MSDDDFTVDEFSPGERKRLRKMLLAHERAAWLWSTIGVWAKWIVAVAAALTALKVSLGDWLRGVKG